MSEDWQPGDLALCLQPNQFGCDATRPGGVYTVVNVGQAISRVSGKLETALFLLEAPHRGGGSSACRFRKIRPHTPDAEDEETIRLLKGERVKA